MNLPKSNAVLDLTTFDRIYAFAHVKWLKEKSKALHALIALCDTELQKETLCDLIERFKYLENADTNKYASAMVDIVQTAWKIPADEAVFAPLDNSDEPDGSQVILQAIKNECRSRDYEAKYYNSVFSAAHYINKSVMVGQNACLILVDDFVGTGTKTIRVIDSLSKHCELKGLHYPFEINSIVIARLSHYAKETSCLFKRYEALFDLRRGISDHHTGSDRDERLDAMRSLEVKLAQYHKLKNGKKRAIQSLGYKGSEALFRAELGTTPNNVFPILHWRWLADGSVRETIISSA